MLRAVTLKQCLNILQSPKNECLILKNNKTETFLFSGFLIDCSQLIVEFIVNLVISEEIKKSQKRRKINGGSKAN
jgi:hypothetical protein